MNLEHLQEVKARIGEIRRRFVGLQETDRAGASGMYRSAETGFGEALRKTQTMKYVRCPQDLEPMITRAAERYGVDPAVVKAVIRTESGFRPNAVSRVGAQGLMQLMPGTARALGVDPADPEQNVDGGVRYLKQQLDKFGSLELALAAYNAGPGAVQRYGGVPPYTETQRYVADVVRNIKLYSGEEE